MMNNPAFESLKKNGRVVLALVFVGLGYTINRQAPDREWENLQYFLGTMAKWTGFWLLVKPIISMARELLNRGKDV